MKIRKGVTLVELIIGLAIMVIIAIILIGTLNPQILIGKSRDTIRKKDLNRIRTSFEEYVNDKGCYPNKQLVALLMNPQNCNNREFLNYPWLKPWPCDPDGNAYQILVDNGDCPKWYKIMTLLENKKDADISTVVGVGGTIGYYVVSSANISASTYIGEIDSTCGYPTAPCYIFSSEGICNRLSSSGGGCIAPNCFSDNCILECQVSCCGMACN